MIMKKQPDIRDVAGYKIDVGPHWDHFSDIDRLRICNGFGPEGWDSNLREALTFLLRLGPAYMPHDIGYFAGGTEQDRLREDRRLYDNCRRVIRQQLGWTRFVRPIRYYTRAREAKAIYWAVKKFGHDAFNYSVPENV